MFLIEHIELRMMGKLHHLPVSRVVVLVGPNSSGKSRFLREIQRVAVKRSGPTIQKEFSIERADIKINEEVLDTEIEIARQKYICKEEKQGGTITSGVIRYSRLDARSLNFIHDDFLVERPRLGGITELSSSLSQFLSSKIIRIDGAFRLNLTNDASSGDVLGEPQNLLHFLLKERQTRNVISDRVFSAFQRYLVIDPTAMTHLRIRLSETLPSSPWIEDSFSSAAREFYSQAQHIADASDGVKAFVGLLMATIPAAPGILLVDEPEAFLHPPLARRLGRDLVQLTEQSEGQLFVATHSSDFLLGCLQASKHVTVIRLTTPFATQAPVVIQPKAIQEFMLLPLFKSTNVVSALFHDGAIVTESDNDRSVYSEVYARLLAQDGGLPDLVFLNAQNWSTEQRIYGPLRRFGIPAAAIMDADAAFGDEFAESLKAANVPDAVIQSIGQLRGNLKAAFKKKGLSFKKVGDLEKLPKQEQEAAQHLFDQLDSYGIFVVRHGELEGWLRSSGVSASTKAEWAVEVLTRLGVDQGEPGHIPTGTEDVWAFVRRVANWCANPDRKGMPLDA